MTSSSPAHTPAAPTTSLPPLGRLPTHSTECIKQAFQNLRDLYFPPTPPSAILCSPKLSFPTRSIQHSIHDKSVPDSGYASAEEDGEEDEISMDSVSSSDGDNDTDMEVQVLHADPLERAFAIKWMTGFITRADVWIDSSESDKDSAERTELLEEATSLLSAFIGNDDEEDVALIRTFSFPTASSPNGPEITVRKPVHVELNDAPLSKDDHTSVGLQSWGSSILLADRFCLEPTFFSLIAPTGNNTLRILELGAGTGMLSIVASKLLHPFAVEIVATDYHPDVLDNLSKNVTTNFPASSYQQAPIAVAALDWEHPSYAAPLDKPFDIILAADVIYHPSHATWIKRCVEHLLARPESETGHNGGVFWLIIPVRTTGRHEGMDRTARIVVLHREEVGRQGSVGRADEGAYKLFKIGWVN
ncbi:putative methyltransferase-domain-containing protein [Flammula alnicola]|nr:putative methyltransferase-domain-containing protein [Flammula alnicola]